jgi:aminoglycoside phosphotransferase (APT) family kinase protein
MADSEPDIALMRRLIDAQFPHWASLDLSAFESAGVDNAAFRLGAHFIVRAPRNEASAAALAKELAWLPKLAGKTTTPIPRIAGAGEASSQFPWPWSVSEWIEGRTVRSGDTLDWRALAKDIATFIKELRAIGATDGPHAGAHNFRRGEPIALRGAITRNAIAALDDRFDKRAACAAWESDASASPWSGAPQWLHGDLHGQNLLVNGAGLCAVIDFGCLGVGDPACDLSLAWRLLPREARAAFREAIEPDEASWRRGRAWALAISVRELEFYGATAPVLTSIATQTIQAVLADHPG